MGRGLNPKPLAEGAAIGAVDGLLRVGIAQHVQSQGGSPSVTGTGGQSTAPTSAVQYLPGVFRAAVGITGYLMRRAGHDYTLTTGLMVSSAALLARQATHAVHDRSLKEVATDLAPSARGHVAASIDHSARASGGTILRSGSDPVIPEYDPGFTTTPQTSPVGAAGALSDYGYAALFDEDPSGTAEASLVQPQTPPIPPGSAPIFEYDSDFTTSPTITPVGLAG